MHFVNVLSEKMTWNDTYESRENLVCTMDIRRSIQPAILRLLVRLKWPGNPVTHPLIASQNSQDLSKSRQHRLHSYSLGPVFQVCSRFSTHISHQRPSTLRIWTKLIQPEYRLDAAARNERWHALHESAQVARIVKHRHIFYVHPKAVIIPSIIPSNLLAWVLQNEKWWSCTMSLFVCW